MAKLARVDFRQLLLDLAAIGLSPVDVAAELSRMLGERVAPSTPYRWLDGSTPLHPHGAALLILHGRARVSAAGIRHGEREQADSPPTRALPVAVPLHVGALPQSDVDEAVSRDREERDERTHYGRAHTVHQRRKR